ncbi:MAG: hypothetical protein ABIV51_10685 [Saprospiraceae bacterium]
MSILQLLFFIFYPFNINPQPCEGYEVKVRVSAKSGLVIRDLPSSKGRVVYKVPYWGKLDACSLRERPDTIDNIPGAWISVKLGKYQGYMFDGYLCEIDSSVDAKTDFRLEFEEINCSCINYDPTLNWYGVYRTNGGDSLLKVEIEIYKMELMENSSIDLLRTNIKDRESLFLIGSKIPLTERKIGYGTDRHDFVYPGQSFRMRGGIVLNALGNVKSIGYCPEIENYKLRLSNEGFGGWNQDLTPDFSMVGECKMMYLIWNGDLDGDQLDDYVFEEAGTVSSVRTLFLSSQATSGNFVKKVNAKNIGGCY